MITGFSASCLIRTRAQFSAKRRLYKLIDNCKLTVYIRAMKRGNDREVSTQRTQAAEEADPTGVNPQHVEKIENILGLLDVAQDIEDMNVPTFRLHALKGDLKGFWAVTVRANWRIIFRFADGRASDVDLIDYH